MRRLLPARTPHHPLGLSFGAYSLRPARRASDAAARCRAPPANGCLLRARRWQCELDIMFNLEKAHFILDEMVMNGCIIETNKNNVLAPVLLLDKASPS